MLFRSGLVAHRLRVRANRELVDCIDLNFDPTRQDISHALAEAAERSGKAVQKKTTEILNFRQLSILENELNTEAVGQLNDGRWRSSFRGREVLRKFAGKYASQLPYEAFRDLIIARMRDAEYEPPGMKAIVHKILDDVP